MSSLLRRRPASVNRARILMAGLATTCLTATYACLGTDPPPVVPQADTPEDGGTPPPAPPTDGGTSSDADTTADASFCQRNGAVPGTETFCADFDGTDVAEGFSIADASAGSPARATDVFASAPASLALSSTNLTWHSEDASERAEVDLRFSLRADPSLGNPATASGAMGLVRLDVGMTQVWLAMANGLPVNGAPFSGYVYRRAAGSSNVLPIDSPLPAQTWVDVHISWLSSGLTISFNSVEVLKAAADALPTSGLVGISVGLMPINQAPQVSRHAIDNLVLTTRRAGN